MIRSLLRSHRGWLYTRLKRAFLLLSLLSVIFCVVLGIFLVVAVSQDHAQITKLTGAMPEKMKIFRRPNNLRTQRPMVQFFPDNQNKFLYRQQRSDLEDINIVLPPLIMDDTFVREVPYEEEVKARLGLDSIMNQNNNGSGIQVTDRVHIFYYPWYANPGTDGYWAHWDHEYLSNWDKSDHRPMPEGKHNPDLGDLGANFYPQLGAYSSRNKTVIGTHMQMIRKAGVQVVVVSWYPPHTADQNGVITDEDDVTRHILDAALKEGLKITLHIEPYPGRSPETLRKHLQFINRTYSRHAAFYKKKGKPLFYIYDSYLTSVDSWRRLLTRKGDLSVRGTSLDATFLGLLVEYKHRNAIKNAGFDGFYTYFASNGFSYGSTWKNWRSLAMFAKKNGLIFNPSLGPGYMDTRVRPWNGQSTRLRRKGAYYALAWRTLQGLNVPITSITSFNEWHEGTQIEPAVPKTVPSYTYHSYSPAFPDFYLTETRKFIDSFLNYKEDKEDVQKL